MVDSNNAEVYNGVFLSDELPVVTNQIYSKGQLELLAHHQTDTG